MYRNDSSYSGLMYMGPSHKPVWTPVPDEQHTDNTDLVLVRLASQAPL